MAESKSLSEAFSTLESGGRVIVKAAVDAIAAWKDGEIADCLEYLDKIADVAATLRGHATLVQSCVEYQAKQLKE